MNITKLNDLTTLITKGTTPSSVGHSFTNSGINYIKSESITPSGTIDTSKFVHINEKTHQKLKRSQLAKDDIMFSIAGMKLGKTAIIKQEHLPANTNQAVAIIRLDHSKILVQYLYYYFQHSLFYRYINKLTAQAAQPNINLTQLGNLDIKYPDYQLQQKIASILSTYDKLIENNTRRIEILEEMAQRIYKEWFVDFKYPGHENDELVDSELGMIPEGWSVEKAKEFVDFHIGGGWGKENSEDKYNIPGYVIRGTDIPSSKVGLIDSCPLRFHAPSNIKSRELMEGDIVFEVSGGSKDQPLGRAVLINQELLESFKNKVICASFCKMIRPESSSEYLYLHLLYIYLNRAIMKYQVQSTGISNFKFQVFLDSHQILKPSIDVLDQFTELTKTIFSQIQILGKKNRNLMQTRDYLLPKLISGKVDVSDLDIDTGILDD